MAVFEPVDSYSSGGAAPYNADVGDFNGDGAMDIAVANINGGRPLGILLNDGNGNFTTRSFTAPPGYAYNVTVGDYDEDGDVDAVLTTFGDLLVMTNDGAGNFSHLRSVPTTLLGGAYNIATGDFNEDGHLDIAAGNNGMGVLYGDGNANFSTPVQIIHPGEFFHDVLVADVNGDGHDDVVGANQTRYGATVVLGNGNGTFLPSTTYVSSGRETKHVAVGDLNNDGRLDIVTANSYSNDIGVLLNDGAGGFTLHGRFASGGGGRPYSVGIADFNNDGNQDVAAVNRHGAATNFFLLVGNGTGSLSLENTYSPGLNTSDAKDVVIADFDDNGSPDVAIVNVGGDVSRSVGVYLNSVVFNTAPTANPGLLSAAEDNSVNGTLTGGDIDGDTLTFAIATAPTRGSLSNFNASTGTFTYTPHPDQNGADSFSFRTNDGEFDSLDAVISIDITPVNDAPVVGAATFSLAENTINGAAVGTVTATDVEGNTPFTWAITAGNAGGAFAINGSGQITVANSSALNFETTPSFSLTVQATDNGSPMASGSATVTVNLTNVNEQPTVNAATFSLPENRPNGTAVGTVTASDPDGGASLTWAITAGNTGGAFAINGSGQITVANTSALNFETTPSFSLTVQATDNGSPVASGSAAVVVNLTNVFEVTGFDVQNGQTQRSYLRHLDLAFAGEAGNLNDLISSGRVRLTKYALNGSGVGQNVSLAGVVSVSGSALHFDFGAGGIASNGNSNARNLTTGDGYYALELDSDGDGNFETRRNFFRLLGDVNGDGRVNSTDWSRILSSYNTGNVENDVNGDGIVNAVDRTLSVRNQSSVLGTLPLDD